VPAIRLISWNPDDAARRARELENAGLRVDSAPLVPSGLVAQFKDLDAVCIDLDRLPSHGREVAGALRNTKALRHIAIVFAGGARDKVARIRKEFPDAVFSPWPRAAQALRKAMRSAPANPVRPPAHMERYSGRTLEQKLGISAGTSAVFFGAPAAFAERFGDLRRSPPPSLIFWFVRSRAELEREMEFMTARLAPGAAMWIAYPKQSGALRSDCTQNDVRAAGLAAGLVDYKICAIDADWSGLKFTRKKPPKTDAVSRK
jgi:hypothetical protein